MPTADERLKKWEEKQAKAKAEIQKIKARKRAAEKKSDTKRKILAGAMLLKQVESGRWPEDKFLSAMDEFLTRDNERKLFGLKPKTEA